MRLTKCLLLVGKIRNNLLRALKQVKRNKGAAGVDGMTTDALSTYLQRHWPDLKEQLLTGTYKPAPVKRVEIPKADGRVRKLGIPTVVDRFIQQAVAQQQTPDSGSGPVHSRRRVELLGGSRFDLALWRTVCRRLRVGEVSRSAPRLPRICL